MNIKKLNAPFVRYAETMYFAESEHQVIEMFTAIR